TGRINVMNKGNTEITNLSLYDVTGQFIQYLQEDNRVDVPNGIYYLKIDFKDGTSKARKVIVSRD
ncbi:MAG: T9SS type A sorting domain-containing protein, partial [Phaeodactylibacter sp.]|nr:T9SS type A sorting domain-containing protein [Phaeodactylibacter sp.]